MNFWFIAVRTEEDPLFVLRSDVNNRKIQLIPTAVKHRRGANNEKKSLSYSQRGGANIVSSYNKNNFQKKLQN